MAWTEHAEISFVNRQHARDIEPFGYRDDDRINEIYSRVGVLTDDFRSAKVIGRSWCFQNHIGIAEQLGKLGNGFRAGIALEQVGDFCDDRDGKKNRLMDCVCDEAHCGVLLLSAIE